MFMTAVCLLLFCYSISDGGQLSSVTKRDKGEMCQQLLATNPIRETCYNAITLRDAEALCKIEDDCVELLEPYFTCAGNDTRAQKEMMVNQLLEECEGQDQTADAVTAAAGAIIPAILVALTAALN